jgi:hypothetical protein
MMDDLDFGWDDDQPASPAPAQTSARPATSAPAAAPATGGGEAPSDKKIAFALRLLAERPGTQEPAGWRLDWRICNTWIDAMKAAPSTDASGAPRGDAPTGKRLSFCESLLSERPGTKEPANWRQDWRICSKFIDEMLLVKVPRAGGSAAAGGRAKSGFNADDAPF